MLDIIKFRLIVTFFLLLNFVIAQHYDIGHNTNYQHINEVAVNNTTFKEVVYVISTNKKIKKIFNGNNTLLEELVFVDDQLVSGIEYFVDAKFPFLQIPRSFKIENIERVVSNYKNVKFSSSLIKYIPKLKKATFKVRVYKHNESEFYLLNTNTSQELYFK